MTNQHSEGAQPPPVQTLSLSLPVGLALLPAADPLGADTYLVSLVGIASESFTTESMVRLMLAVFMVGMVIGQLVIDVLSDSLGREKSSLIATLVFLGSPILCAVIPDIGTLIAMRPFQGLADGFIIVLAHSVAPDFLTGKASAKALPTLMSTSSTAPAVAPLVGGFLESAFGWRSAFWLLAAISVAMVTIVILTVPGTLPPEECLTGTLYNLLSNVGRLLRRPVSIGYMLAFVGGFIVMFSYITMSPLIFQELLGPAPVQFSLVFAFNVAMLTFVSVLNGKMINRFHPHKSILIGSTIAFVTSTGLIINILIGITFFATWLLLLITVLVTPLIFANAMAFGIEEVRDIGIGSGFGLTGLAQLLAVAMIAPLVGLSSSLSSSMAISILTCALIALITVLTLTCDSLHSRPHRLA